MFQSKLRAGLVGVIASCGLAGAGLVPAAAQAEPISGSGGAAGCAVFHAATGTSEIVPDGTLIIAASGSILKCSNGQWVKVGLVFSPGGPLVGPTGPIALAPPTLR